MIDLKCTVKTWNYFMTMFTRTCHLALILSEIKTVYAPYHISWRLTLLYLSIHCKVFQILSFPQESPPNPCMLPSFPNTCYVFRPSYSSWSPAYGWRGAESVNLLVMHSPPVPRYLFPPTPKYLSHHPFFKHPHPVFFISVWGNKIHAHTKQQTKLYSNLFSQ